MFDRVKMLPGKPASPTSVPWCDLGFASDFSFLLMRPCYLGSCQPQKGLRCNTCFQFQHGYCRYLGNEADRSTCSLLSLAHILSLSSLPISRTSLSNNVKKKKKMKEIRSRKHKPLSPNHTATTELTFYLVYTLDDERESHPQAG